MFQGFVALEHLTLSLIWQIKVPSAERRAEYMAMIATISLSSAYSRPSLAIISKAKPVRPATLDAAAERTSQTSASDRDLTASAPGAKEPDKSVLRLQKIATETRAANEKLKKDMKTARRDTIDRAKAAAKAKIQELVKRLELLKKMYGDNPKEMARQLAALAKEFKQAIKDYASAAKDSGGMIAEERKDLAASDMTAEARAEASKTLDEEEKMLARGDLDFIKTARGVSNKLKEELQTAKIKGTLTVKGKFEESDEYKDAEKSIKEVDEANNDFEQDVTNSMPAGTLFEIKV